MFKIALALALVSPVFLAPADNNHYGNVITDPAFTSFYNNELQLDEDRREITVLLENLKNGSATTIPIENKYGAKGKDIREAKANKHNKGYRIYYAMLNNVLYVLTGQVKEGTKGKTDQTQKNKINNAQAIFTNIKNKIANKAMQQAPTNQLSNKVIKQNKFLAKQNKNN